MRRQFYFNEMVQGYRDGTDPTAPVPSMNRSASYIHGFANARDDARKLPRDTAEALRRAAEETLAHDETI